MTGADLNRVTKDGNFQTVLCNTHSKPRYVSRCEILLSNRTFAQLEQLTSKFMIELASVGLIRFLNTLRRESNRLFLLSKLKSVLIGCKNIHSHATSFVILQQLSYAGKHCVYFKRVVKQVQKVTLVSS